MKTNRWTKHAAVAAGLVLAAAANAHFFAVHLTHYIVDLGGQEHGATPPATAAYIGWSHIYPVEEPLKRDMLGIYDLVGPNGERTPLEANPGGFLFAPAKPQTAGAYIVHAAYRDHFFTWYEEDGEEKEFDGPKTGLDNIVYSGYFEFRSKALLQANEAAVDAFTTPLGDTFELVPTTNPYAQGHDGTKHLEVKVLLDGEPAPDVLVQARPASHWPRTRFAQMIISDEDGIAEIEITERGLWLISASMTRDPRPVFAEKCDIEEFMASLTFEAR